MESILIFITKILLFEVTYILQGVSMFETPFTSLNLEIE